MNIQAGYGVLSYQNAYRVGVAKQGAAATKSALDTGALLGGTSSTTRVSISEAARNLASAEAGIATEGRTALQQQLIQSAAADPQGAEKMAYDFANVPSQIVYDISDQLASGTCGPVNKLAGSGRIIDDVFKENFSKEAALIDSQRRAIYDSEKAKGTPAPEILAKMIDFTNAQSSDYLEGIGWLAKSSA